MIQQKSPWLELVVMGADQGVSVPRKILLGIKAIPSYGGYLPPQMQSVVPICDGDEANRNRERVAKSEQMGYYNRQTQVYWNWRDQMDAAEKWLMPPSELRLGKVNPINKKTTRKDRGNEVNRAMEMAQREKVNVEVSALNEKENKEALRWLRGLGK